MCFLSVCAIDGCDVCLHVCTYIYMWKPEVDIGRLRSLFTCIDVGSVLNLEAGALANLAKPPCPGTPSLPPVLWLQKAALPTQRLCAV